MYKTDDPFLENDVAAAVITLLLELKDNRWLNACVVFLSLTAVHVSLVEVCRGALSRGWATVIIGFLFLLMFRGACVVWRAVKETHGVLRGLSFLSEP